MTRQACKTVLLALLVAWLAAACSALSLAYLNAPALSVLWINRALDLPDAQREALADAAAEVYQWHLDEPRRELVTLLREAQRRVAAPLAPSDGQWLVDELQDHVRRLGERLALTLGPRLPPLSAADIARIEQRLARRLSEYAEKNAEGDRARQIERRIERIEASADDWLGSVSSAQRTMIAASDAVQGFDARLWVSERARRERELVAALGRTDGGAGLGAWFRDWRSGRTPEVAARLDAQRDASIALWVALINDASEGQRRHLVERLAQWAQALEAAGS